jgi:hypothetical protein
LKDGNLPPELFGMDTPFLVKPRASESFGVLDVESGLKPSKRGLTSDCFFNFLQDFQAILYRGDQQIVEDAAWANAEYRHNRDI